VSPKKATIMTNNCHDPKPLLHSKSGNFAELRVQPGNLVGMECRWRRVYAFWTFIFNNAEITKHFSVLSLVLVCMQNFWVMPVCLWLADVFCWHFFIILAMELHKEVHTGSSDWGKSHEECPWTTWRHFPQPTDMEPQYLILTLAASCCYPRKPEDG
jgi:hypothetical protein